MNTCLQFSDPASLLHRSLDASKASKSQYHRELSRHFSPAAAVRTTTDWQAAYEADDGNSGARLPRRFSESSGRDRGVCARSRNVRRLRSSFFQFVAFTEPSFAALAQRVWLYPTNALIEGPSRSDSADERRYSLLRIELRGEAEDPDLPLVAAETGLRISELHFVFVVMTLSLQRKDPVRCQGKGRKEQLDAAAQDVVEL